MIGTTLDLSTAYHPQSDGQTENTNKTVEMVLRAVVNWEQDDWDEHLPMIELAINSSKQASTGFSPFELTFGRVATLPIDAAIAPLCQQDNPAALQRIEKMHAVWKQARNALETAQKRQSHYANQQRRGVSIQIGDQVLLSTEHLKFVEGNRRTPKLASKLIGPFTVKRVASNNAYELELPNELRLLHSTINANRLKVYKDGTAAFPDRPVADTRPPPNTYSDNGSPVYNVERILAHRGQGPRIKYLVKWENYPMFEATWEPLKNLRGTAEEIIADYHKVSVDRDSS